MICERVMNEKAHTTGQAVTPLLDKQAPGLVHGMLAASLVITPCRFWDSPPFMTIS